jgi:DMSO/TMAO reductase YedYZ molybdopterin-dependent catalytic subunit
MTPPSEIAAHPPRHLRALTGALVGLLAAAVAMGAAQFASGLGVPQSSPVLAVGQAAIDLTPPPVKDFAISEFGADDKTVLLGGILVVIALYAAVVGMLAVRRLAFGMWGLAIFASIGLAAALTRPTATAGYVVPTLVGAAAGAFALAWLARAAAGLGSPTTRTGPRDRRASRGSRAFRTTIVRPDATTPTDALTPPDLPPFPDISVPPDLSTLPGLSAQADDIAPSALHPEPAERKPPTDSAGAAKPALRAGPAYSFTYLPHPDDRAPSPWPARRRFLVSSGAAAAAAALGTVAGRNLTDEHNVAAARTAIRFPPPAVPAPPLPAGSNLNIPGLSSFITPDSSFYRVDTALLVPQVDPATWQLRIHGMVQREVTITFAELLRRPLIEAYVTLTCVSDPVEGPYVGNAKWLGASLADLVRQARPLAGANQLLCTSIDGFTCGTPLQVVLDGRNALLAVAMNGAALPVVHGFPARMVVPGLYGYVSATKWVTDIEVTTFASAVAYWAQRGWSQQAPIKTESRIDVPTGGAPLAPGRIPVAGVAWAQHKGVAAVEVRVNGGPWHEARLAAVPDIDTWRQWVWEWPATPGNYLLEARATDATGYTQTAVQAGPPPSGASGYPSAQVTVRSGLRLAAMRGMKRSSTISRTRSSGMGLKVISMSWRIRSNGMDRTIGGMRSRSISPRSRARR